MATTARAATREGGQAAKTGGALRIYHAGIGLDAAASCRAAASSGFSDVLISPPWPRGGMDNPYISLSLGTADGAELAPWVSAAGSAGIGLLLDVVVDRLAARSPLVNAGAPFAPVGDDVLLDPRRSEGADAARARLGDEGDARALAAWWAPTLSKWVAGGLRGFRLLGLEHFSRQTLVAFMGTLRQSVPEAILLCWTPGMARDVALGLSGLGLDGVFASTAWWDWQSDWLWREIEALATIAPVLGVDGFAPGPARAAVKGEPRNLALAAVIGQGWMHVAGKEDAAPAMAARALNIAIAAQPMLGRMSPILLPLGAVGPVLAVARLDGADARSSGKAVLTLIDGSRGRLPVVSATKLLPAFCGRFTRFEAADGRGDVLAAGTAVTFGDAAYRVFAAEAVTNGAGSAAKELRGAAAAAAAPRLAVEGVSPAVDGGDFPVKAIAGEVVDVQADIVFDGHEKIAVALRWYGPQGSWQECRMRPLGNDRWQAGFGLETLGRYKYVVSAWRDRFETFRDEIAKKSQAGLDVRIELQEGITLLRDASQRSDARVSGELQKVLASAAAGSDSVKLQVLLSSDLADLMALADDRPFLVESRAMPVDAERLGARFASWYEVFPRSMSDDEARHGTFADVIKHLPRIAAMGFDVLYFPPISPIGTTNRKGRNNSLTPAREDPGSPYAIGSAEGGHDALHPELGTFEDFARLREAAAEHGLELAIDFAIQCSPDHPWLKQHPGWFDWRPDGTIKYAENPPKRYEDIVNVDFYGKDSVPGLWAALCDVVLFWAGQGVRLFRVDNPHTKPFPFWEWMIAEVRRHHPDAIFLAEAFTRPKIMYRLAKIGFSQSYTYFTWRNTKRELEAYLTELDTEPPRDFFRPHFFVNTPDINPIFLQTSGRPGFLIRAALAATLSGLWGVYNGFELCEAGALPGREEYKDSEKYQLRAWDWDRPGNIVAEVTALNRMRRQNLALQTHRGISFLPAYNDAVIVYEKATLDRSNVLIIAVSWIPILSRKPILRFHFGGGLCQMMRPCRCMI